jgi:DNA-binding GntR family transcriptional regulator
VRTRKGWYVVEPSIEEARDAFAARRAVEGGMLRQTEGRPLQAVVRRLRKHIGDEKWAIEGADAATRAFLLADFHVCLAECLGHRMLADMLRDLTARTTLVATLYQSRHDAAESCTDHARIVSALEAGDVARAESLMLAHIGNVESALGVSAAPESDAREKLRRRNSAYAHSGIHNTGDDSEHRGHSIQDRRLAWQTPQRSWIASFPSTSSA